MDVHERLIFLAIVSDSMNFLYVLIQLPKLILISTSYKNILFLQEVEIIIPEKEGCTFSHI